MTSRQPAPDGVDLPARIVAAAAALLAEHGVSGLTTRAVASAAGVQAPTLYRLFGDKDGLIDALAEHVMESYVATEVMSHDADPVVELRAGWHAHVDFALAHPDLQAVLNAPGRARDSAATRAGIEVLRERIRRVAAVGLLRVSLERAVLVVHAAGTGTVTALLGVPPDRRDDGLSEAMLDAVTRVILRDEPAVPDDRVISVATTFATVVSDLPGLSAAERALMAEWVARSLAATAAPAAPSTAET